MGCIFSQPNCLQQRSTTMSLINKVILIYKNIRKIVTHVQKSVFLKSFHKICRNNIQRKIGATYTRILSPLFIFLLYLTPLLLMWQGLKIQKESNPNLQKHWKNSFLCFQKTTKQVYKHFYYFHLIFRKVENIYLFTFFAIAFI